MKFLLLSLLIICGRLIAADYYLKRGEDVVRIPFSYSGKALVNDICLKNAKKCLALHNYNNPLKKKITSTGSNPAQAYCKAIKGVPFTLFSKGLTQGNSFCAFVDKTLISSWDLYQSYVGAAK